jgi:hypothetical protein
MSRSRWLKGVQVPNNILRNEMKVKFAIARAQSLAREARALPRSKSRSTASCEQLVRRRVRTAFLPHFCRVETTAEPQIDFAGFFVIRYGHSET